jgi:aryl-alcohol dehydrogenase-like predicted oxidoreductase
MALNPAVPITLPLGSTGLVASRLGLGLAALGRPAYINLGRSRDLGRDRGVADLEQRCHEVLDAAYAAGVRYFDAARSYGMAERFLGTWLRAHQPSRDAITIGSKWGYTYVGSWKLDARVHEVKDHSLETLRRQIVESRSLLGDYLRLYQVHSATLDSRVLENTAVLRELLRLQSCGPGPSAVEGPGPGGVEGPGPSGVEGPGPGGVEGPGPSGVEGLVIGLSVSGPNQADVIRRALDVSVDGRNPFQAVQATWNLLEPSAGGALADAKARGWVVIVKEALANGRLTDRAEGEYAGALRTLADSHAASVDAVALGAALSNRWADVVLSGAVTTGQLESNLRALALATSLTEWPAMAESPPDYWTRRGALPWQ